MFVTVTACVARLSSPLLPFYGWIVKASPCVSRIYLGLSIFVLVFQTFVFLSVCNGVTDMAGGMFFLFPTRDLFFKFVDFAVSPNYICRFSFVFPEM